MQELSLGDCPLPVLDEDASVHATGSFGGDAGSQPGHEQAALRARDDLLEGKESQGPITVMNYVLVVWRRSDKRLGQTTAPRRSGARPD